MMIDYRKRYQTIKDKGEELSLNISSYLDKKYFLFFNNSYYANFREIPLEDYINIKKSKEDIGLFPIISKTFEGIEPIKEGEEYYSLGYKITKYLRVDDKYNFEDDNNLQEMTKEKVIMRQYLPLELSYLFNTHNEASIEDTLARYIKTIFNTPLNDETLKKEISKSFNKYALILSIIYGGGFLLHPEYKAPSKDTNFKAHLLTALLLEKGSLDAIQEQIKEDRERVLNSSGDDELIAHWGGIPPQEKERDISLNVFKHLVEHIKKLAKPENTPKDSVIYEELAYNEITKQTPHKTEKGEDAIYPLTLTSSEDSYLRLLCMYLNLVISNSRTIEEKKIYINTLESVLSNNEIFKDYEAKFNYLVSGEYKQVEKTPTASELYQDEDKKSYLPSSTMTLDILKVFNFTTQKVKDEETLKDIDNNLSNYRKYLEIDSLISKNNKELIEEMKANNSAKVKELKNTIANLTIEKEKIDTSRVNQYGVIGFLKIGDDYHRTLGQLPIPISPTDSDIILNKNTKISASNSIIKRIGDNSQIITDLLLFFMKESIFQNSFTLKIENWKIESLILGDKYKDATPTERYNARNKTFLYYCDTLARTLLQTSTSESEAQKHKQYYSRRMKKLGAIISSVDNTNYKYVKVVLNDDFYNVVINDLKSYAPLSKNIDKIPTPRARITAYLLHIFYFYNNRDTGKVEDYILHISFKSLNEYNPVYKSNYLRYFKNTAREKYYTPILEDLEEMLSAGVIEAYTPPIQDYRARKVNLDINYILEIEFSMKPQASKKKAK